MLQKITVFLDDMHLNGKMVTCKWKQDNYSNKDSETHKLVTEIFRKMKLILTMVFPHTQQGSTVDNT